jgi:hypothetical protein
MRSEGGTSGHTDGRRVASVVPTPHRHYVWIVTDQSEYVLALRQGFEGEFGGAELARLLRPGPWGEDARRTLLLLQRIEDQTGDQMASLLREADVAPETRITLKDLWRWQLSFGARSGTKSGQLVRRRHQVGAIDV